MPFAKISFARWTIMLGVVAVSPALSAPSWLPPWARIDDPTGRYLYIGAVLSLAISAWVASGREERAQAEMVERAEAETRATRDRFSILGKLVEASGDAAMRREIEKLRREKYYD